MILQEKRILCSVKEVDKHHLWLRPRLDRDGYDLLYWGANGWTPLFDCCNNTLTSCPPADSALVECPPVMEESIDNVEDNIKPCNCNN